MIDPYFGTQNSSYKLIWG